MARVASGGVRVIGWPTLIKMIGCARDARGRGEGLDLQKFCFRAVDDVKVACESSVQIGVWSARAQLCRGSDCKKSNRSEKRAIFKKKLKFKFFLKIALFRQVSPFPRSEPQARPPSHLGAAYVRPRVSPESAAKTHQNVSLDSAHPITMQTASRSATRGL